MAECEAQEIERTAASSAVQEKLQCGIKAAVQKQF